jgi:hypothetical protein
MTPKERVLKIHPSAICRSVEYVGDETIQKYGILLDGHSTYADAVGISPREAWFNAENECYQSLKEDCGEP